MMPLMEPSLPKANVSAPVLPVRFSMPVKFSGGKPATGIRGGEVRIAMCPDVHLEGVDGGAVIGPRVGNMSAGRWIGAEELVSVTACAAVKVEPAGTGAGDGDLIVPLRCRDVQQ